MFLYFMLTVQEEYKNYQAFTLTDEEKTVSLVELETELNDNYSGYEVLDATGELQPEGFVVLNNIPITNDGKEIFESRFLNRSRLIEKEPGFVALRILRPLDSDTYIILTQWEKQAHFSDWQQSDAYAHQHRHRETSEGIVQQHGSIFARPTFVTTYQVSND